jgi:hypothetical protein
MVGGRGRVELSCVILAVTLVGCGSPEATRARGGGPGADVGNRGPTVYMHGGSEPYFETPRMLAPRFAGGTAPDLAGTGAVAPTKVAPEAAPKAAR